MKQLALFLLILSSTCQAQDEQLSVSAHFGYSLSELMFSYDELDFRSTYNAGIEIRKRLGESQFFLQTGLRWNEFGWSQWIRSWVEFDSYYITSLDRYKFTYFFASIPIITTYKFKKGIPGLTLSAGPQVSFPLFHKTKVNDDISFSPPHQPALNFSTHFALGYEHQIRDNWILAGDLYTNLLFPEFIYNFGIGLTGRYILK